MRSLGFVDGKIIDLAENAVPLEDRGHQFGDGIYEVTKVYNGKCFALNRHIERAYRSLRELKIPAVYTYEEFEELHNLLIKESDIQEGAIYLQITRGVAPRAHGFPDNVVPRLTMSIRPTVSNANLLESGVKGLLIPDERWLRCDIKSLNLLGNILGKQKAKEAGCFEAIQIRDGIVTEGTSSNFFLVKDEILWTHPVSNLILKGVTRSIIIDELAPALNLTVLEKTFSPEFIQKADEAFISGTTSEIMPITAFGSVSVGDGKVGPITRKLQQAYHSLVTKECGQ